MIVTVFRSRLNPDAAARAAYEALAPRIAERARAMPGYVSHKSYVADDGERVTIVEFESMQAQQAWSQQAEHVEAKRQGRASFYEAFRIQVCEQLRESRFP